MPEEIKEEKEKRKHSDRYLLKRLAKYLFLDKRTLATASIAIIIGSLLDILGPIILKDAIDVGIEKQDINRLIILGTIFIIIYLGLGITTYFRVWLLGVLGHTGLYQLRKDTFEHIQDLGMDFFDKEPTGEIMARMTNDIDRLQTIVSGEVLNAVISLMTVFFMYLIMLSISPFLSFVTLVIIPFILLFTVLQRKLERPRWRKWNDTNGKVVSMMQEHIAGARISQSFARSEENQREFNNLSQTFYHDEMHAVSATAFIWSLSSELIGVIGTLVIIYFGGSMILNEQTGITAGVIVLFLTYQAKFMQPIFTLTNIYSQLQTAFSSMERIIIVLDRSTTTPELVNAENLICNKGEVCFSNVTFCYEKNKPILKNFNLNVKSKETLAIVGETGSGKTTIANLIPRFYEIKSGTIRIDGTDIRKVTLESLRNSVSAVLQEPFLFSSSIRDNLCYRVKVSDEQLWEILEIIGADFVRKLPKGLDTKMKERGCRLSLGQRQLISFARALIGNPKILILDEATASIDPQAELKIQKSLKESFYDRTTIIIAHRLSTVRDADRIIVLDKGNIIEEGSYNELMAKKGYFHELYQAQFRELSAVPT